MPASANGRNACLRRASPSDNDSNCASGTRSPLFDGYYSTRSTDELSERTALSTVYALMNVNRAKRQMIIMATLLTTIPPFCDN